MKQQIIFRFTIPNDSNSFPPSFSKCVVDCSNVAPSEYFTVYAFGQEYLVEYPSGITGVRRPCANRLGYICLPTYYEAPPVEHLGGKRYRVQVPPEISSGEECYVSLPDTGTPPLQVRLVLPDPWTPILEFETPDDTSSRGAIPCRWKHPEPPRTTIQVIAPPPLRSTPSPLDWDQTGFFLTHLGSLPVVASRPSTLNSSITFAIPLRDLPSLGQCDKNHGIEQQGTNVGEWHRMYNITSDSLQWFHLLTQISNDQTTKLLAKQAPLAWVCHLMKFEKTLTDHPSSSVPTQLTKRSPWQLVPALEAPGLSIVLKSYDRKTLQGSCQIIGTFWDLVNLSEHRRQICIAKWRLKLQGEGLENVLHIPESSDDHQLLDSISQALNDHLTSPRLMRGPWRLTGPCFHEHWSQELAIRLMRYELRPTPGNHQRWEMHSHSRLPSCRLLGLLVGKSLVDGNTPLFGKEANLANYIYKHMLQWPIHDEDYLEVVGPTNTSMRSQNNYSVLGHRLFEHAKNPISSFLDGVFTIVPQSFFFVFRSVNELQACLVNDLPSRSVSLS